MPKRPSSARSFELFCLQMAAECRNYSIDGLPPELKESFLRIARIWEAKAELFDIGPVKPLRETLAALSQLAEERVPGAVAGFTLVDGTRTFFSEAVFPSLPGFFQDSIASIPISVPYVGTCAESIATGAAVTCGDILSDSRFDPKWRALCARSGLKAVQSHPISLGEGMYEGTFVIGFKEVATAEFWNDGVMREFANLGAEAIKQNQIDSDSSID